MANGPQKKSVTVSGHRTSISLEPIFWRLLNDAAEAAGKIARANERAKKRGQR